MKEKNKAVYHTELIKLVEKTCKDSIANKDRDFSLVGFFVPLGLSLFPDFYDALGNVKNYLNTAAQFYRFSTYLNGFQQSIVSHLTFIAMLFAMPKIYHWLSTPTKETSTSGVVFHNEENLIPVSAFIEKSTRDKLAQLSAVAKELKKTGAPTKEKQFISLFAEVQNEINSGYFEHLGNLVMVLVLLGSFISIYAFFNLIPMILFSRFFLPSIFYKLNEHIYQDKEKNLGENLVTQTSKISDGLIAKNFWSTYQYANHALCILEISGHTITTNDKKISLPTAIFLDCIKSIVAEYPELEITSSSAKHLIFKNNAVISDEKIMAMRQALAQRLQNYQTASQQAHKKLRQLSELMKPLTSRSWEKIYEARVDGSAIFYFLFDISLFSEKRQNQIIENIKLLYLKEGEKPEQQNRLLLTKEGFLIIKDSELAPEEKFRGVLADVCAQDSREDHIDVNHDKNDIEEPSPSQTFGQRQNKSPNKPKSSTYSIRSIFSLFNISSTPSELIYWHEVGLSYNDKNPQCKVYPMSFGVTKDKKFTHFITSELGEDEYTEIIKKGNVVGSEGQTGIVQVIPPVKYKDSIINFKVKNPAQDERALISLKTATLVRDSHGIERVCLLYSVVAIVDHKEFAKLKKIKPRVAKEFKKTMIDEITYDAQNTSSATTAAMISN